MCAVAADGAGDAGLGVDRAVRGVADLDVADGEAAAAAQQPRLGRGALPARRGEVGDAQLQRRPRPLAGPLTAQQWQAARASGAGPAARPAFRIFAGAFHLHPAPARAGGRIAFEYVTRNVVVSASGAGRRSWQEDDDRFALSEEIATMGVKWRFKKAVGLAYDDDLDEYLSVLSRAIARDGGRPVLRADGAAALPFPAAIPEGDFPEV